MVGLQAEAVGAMPGSPEEVSPLTVTDSVFLFNWYSAFVSGRGQAVMRNNSFSRSLLLKAVFQTDTVLRNNVYESLQPGKKGSQLFIGHDRMNSDYNCFSWDPENDVRNVSWLTRRREKAAHGLAEWQEIFDQDTNSIEAHPGSGLSEIAGIGRGGKVARGQRLKIEDMLLPPDSPCQGAGEDGEDIGPRWERFLAN